MSKEMNVVDIEVSKLMPYWHNPRKNDRTVEKLVQSIKDNGFTVPLVVNKDMVLITGHARLKAAKKMGRTTVPCVVVDFTEEQAKKYRIADNKIQESTEWDEDALFKELREIGDPMAIVGMGFTAEEVENIIGDIDSLLDEATDINVEEVPVYKVAPAKPAEVVMMSGDDDEEDDSDNTSYFEPTQESKKAAMEDLAQRLKEREQELSGRFVRESYEQTKYDNVVVCPHCGQQFKVRGVK